MQCFQADGIPTILAPFGIHDLGDLVENLLDSWREILEDPLEVF